MAKCPECNSKIQKRNILLRLGNTPFFCKSCSVCLRVQIEDMMILLLLINVPSVLIAMLYVMSKFEPGFIFLFVVWLVISLSIYVRFSKIAREDLDKCTGQQSNNRLEE